MIAPLLGTVLLAAPATALAHAFGEPVQLPMPYGLYIAGSVLALVLSFALLAIGGQPGSKLLSGLNAYRTLPLPAWPARWLDRARAAGSALWLSVLLFCIVTGLVGSNDSHRNFNMTFFWILFVLGGAYASMLIGDWYKHQHPWRFLLPRGWIGVRKYPRWLGHWPAFAQLVCLIAIELFFHSTPRKLALLLLAFGIFNLAGMWLWGTRRWLQRGELFAVLFRLFAACTPLRRTRSSDGKYRWRIALPFSDLRRLRLWHPAQCLFVLFLLSSTAYDGLRETAVYFNVFWQDPWGILTAAFGDHPLKIYPQVRPWFIAWEMALLIVSPFFYLLLFVLFIALGRMLTGSKQPIALLLCRYLPSLVPIAVVYHLTHYYTLLFSQGLKIRGLVSDPFGWGWNLFGSAITGRLPWLPDMANIWTSQVLLILVGHVAAVWLAHQQALQLERSNRRATLSQLPMLVLMVVFTSVGLWILAQPLQG
ncbi:MAG: hypothetical protein A0129_01070 [Limnobacter sp. CACIAM 66H1]|uniref:hypothetical protein n=1 Tax=Limnobacter sp. CACIAM 66H1 TaxID=1813033 RepID=UPI0007A7EDBD|nr:hypothetical protein [Limnobacter sp. CACIAM 66H1]KYP12737.1 MAG: hypothetical protein A0129_01070 [Limnobacter sp. CACIAM 66H1]